MKKLVLISILASAMFLNTACTDEEVAAGIIGVGVGIGIAAGANDHDHHHHYDPPPRYPGPDYGHCGYHGCRPRRGYYSADVTLATPVNFDTTAVSDSQVLEFANKYNVSTDAAAKIQSAFENVKAQGISSFATIGLNKSDLQSIAQRQMPADNSVASLGQKLNLSASQATDLIKVLIKDFDAQAADVNSDYWQSCMAQGKWKTPQNLYCTSTSWQGCAPQTGATLCY